jgi:lysophospholipase L1-like esterase
MPAMLLASLCSAVANVLARRGWAAGGVARAARPALEALEGRCLPSAPTTVPSPTGVNPFVAVGLEEAAGLPRNNAAIVFLGDSITWGFAYGLGRPVWDATLAPGAADYGVNFAATQNVLWQLEAGQLLGTFPSVVVLGIGINNLFDGDTPQATAAGVLADVRAIHAAAPQAEVLVVGVLPTGPTPQDPFRAAASQVNALVSRALAGDPRALFADVGRAVEQPDGSISPWTLIDYVHPTALGYADLTWALLPSLEQAFFLSLNAPPVL